MDELLKKLKQYYEQIKFSVYVCDKCGYAKGHQCIYCTKCNGKMKYRKNISQYDLGLLNKEAFEWNVWSNLSCFFKENKELILNSGLELNEFDNNNLTITEFRKLLDELAKGKNI